MARPRLRASSRSTSVAPAPGPAPASRADKELLLKGVLCALIGALVLLAPYLARSPSVQQLMAGMTAVGWFALLLGCALVGLYLRRRHAAATRSARPTR